MMLKPKSKIILGIVALFTISLTVLIWEPWEPRYQGKKLDYWLMQLDEENIKEERIREAIRGIGPSHLSRIVTDLEGKPTLFELKFLPLLKKQKIIPIHYKTSQERRQEASTCLFFMKELAKPALPDLYNRIEQDPWAIVLVFHIDGTNAFSDVFNLLENKSVNVRKDTLNALSLILMDNILESVDGIIITGIPQEKKRELAELA